MKTCYTFIMPATLLLLSQAYGFNYALTMAEETFTAGDPIPLDTRLAVVRNGPSAILHGSSEILAADALENPFNTQSLELLPTQSGSFYIAQQEFELQQPNTDSLSIGMSLYLDNFQTGSGGAFIPDEQSDYFSILFDTPGVERIDFTSSGSATSGRVLVHGGTEEIGTFDYGTIMQILVDVDVLNNTWAISISQNSTTVAELSNSATFYEEFGQNTYSGQIESVRFALVDGTADGSNSPQAIYDDVSIVPEPAEGLWLFAILPALAVALRRRFISNRKELLL